MSDPATLASDDGSVRTSLPTRAAPRLNESSASVLTYARLKRRLVTNTLLSGASDWFSFLLWLLPAAIATTVGVAAMVLGSSEARTDWLVLLVGFVIWFGWLTAPVIFGSDDMIDPTRLVLLPLGPSELRRALLVLTAVGPWPVGGLIVLATAALFAPDPISAWVILVGAVIHLVSAISWSRAGSTKLSQAVDSRSWRDRRNLLASLVASMAGLSFQIGPWLWRQLPDQVREVTATVVGWTPLGLAPAGMADALAGHLGLGVLRIGLAGVWALLGAALWSRQLTALVRGQSSAAAASDVGSDARATLFNGAMSWVPRNPIGAAAGREWAEMLRHPMLRLNLVLQPTFALGAILVLGRSPIADRSHWVVFLALLLSVMFMIETPGNLLGRVGKGAWLDGVSTTDWRSVLVGRSLPHMVLAFSSATGVAWALAAYVGNWAAIPTTTVLAGALSTYLGGTGIWRSVRFPVPVPETIGRRMGAGASAASGFASLVMTLVAAAPAGFVIILVIVADRFHWAAGWAGSLLALGAAALVLRSATAGLSADVGARWPAIEADLTV